MAVKRSQLMQVLHGGHDGEPRRPSVNAATVLPRPRGFPFAVHFRMIGRQLAALM
jgi:hypothetical protein